MGQVVEAAELVGHGVHVPEAGVVEGHTGKVLGVAHAFAGVDVAVGHGAAQVFETETSLMAFRHSVGQRVAPVERRLQPRG